MESSNKQRSIRMAVLALFAASIVVSVLLLLAFESAVTSYYRGETSLLTRIFKPVQAVAGSARTMVHVMRRFNAALLQGPDAPTQQPFLSDLARRSFPLSIVMRIGDRISFSSIPADYKGDVHLTAFGAPSPAEPFSDEQSEVRIIYQFDFRTSDAQNASFFLLRMPGDDPRHLPFSRQLGLIIALILLAADGAAGVYFILRVTTPLRRVEAAALAMSRGDLSTPVEGGDQILELARVFAALETMRSKIVELLALEHERESERRELIANLSHDLRTPLAAIRGYVDGLREGIADTPEKIGRYLSVLGQKIQDLDHMIGQIFLLSTLEARETPPTFREIDFRAFLSDCVEELELSIPSGELRIEQEGMCCEPCRIAADPLQLRRLLENLVENSIKHAGKKPVTVRLTLAEEGSMARLDIEDDGRGIPTQEAERVFDRFYRSDPSRSGGGVGLGLSIAKQIAEANGGKLRIVLPGDDAGQENRPRLQGAHFVFELPLARERHDE
jgi:signal transduction histidine kinase